MKTSKRSKSKPNLKTLKAKAWKLMSEYIRSKDKDKIDFITCYTCPKYAHWREFHCGHHFHGRLDYDERNLKPQCVGCNRYKHGNLHLYAERLISENGQAWYKKLKLDANTHKGYKDLELKKIIKYLDERLEA
jgi:hypothetical protein